MYSVLGAGGIGCLAASRIPGSTLILRNSHRLYQYKQVDETITMTGDQNYQTRVPGTTPQTLADGSISHLVVATKAPDTVAALTPLLPKLAANPTIVLLQNGFGTGAEVRKLLLDRDLRLVYAITSQGVKHTPAAFQFEQSGTGPFLYSSPSIDAIETIEGFKYLDWRKFEMARLHKLLANAVINPLTALLRCKNGALGDEKFRYVIRPIVAESCSILNAAFSQQFDPESVMAQVLQVATSTSTNTSSMLADVLAGRKTEVDYINGALVKLGQESGVRTTHNAMLRDLVELSKSSDPVPFVWSDLGRFMGS